MKLLLVHRYLRPDPPGYAQMLYIIGQHLAADGHQVTIFSTQPKSGDSFPIRESVDGMTVVRLPILDERTRPRFGKALNAAWFAMALLPFAILRASPFERVFVSTHPPVIMGVVARLISALRETSYVYHCMDLYPEIAVDSGLMRGQRVLEPLARRIDASTCAKAEAVVVLSEDMKATVRERGVSDSNISVINNFSLDRLTVNGESTLQFFPNAESFRIVYAGNIGRFQRLDELLDAVTSPDVHPSVELWFIGSGVLEDSLKAKAGELLEKRIFFRPHVPVDELLPILSESHLGVVSLSPNIIRSAYPSKTMTYLEAGCRMLCLVEETSQLAKFVDDNLLGVVSSGGSSDISAAIASEVETNHPVGERKRIQQVGREHFDQEVILASWVQLLTDLQEQRP